MKTIRYFLMFSILFAKLEASVIASDAVGLSARSLTPVLPQADLPPSKTIAWQTIQKSYPNESAKQFGVPFARRIIGDPAQRARAVGHFAESQFIRDHQNWQLIEKPNDPQFDVYRELRGKREYGQIKAFADGDPKKYWRALRDDSQADPASPPEMKALSLNAAVVALEAGMSDLTSPPPPTPLFKAIGFERDRLALELEMDLPTGTLLPAVSGEGFVKVLDTPALPAIKSVPLDKLTVVDDPEFFQRLEAVTNAPAFLQQLKAFYS